MKSFDKTEKNIGSQNVLTEVTVFDKVDTSLKPKSKLGTLLIQDGPNAQNIDSPV